MAYYRDLATCDYFGPSDNQLIAVGWLAPGHEYSHGSVTSEFFRALALLLVEPWQPMVFWGRASCFLCRFSSGPADVEYEGMKLNVGWANLFVPGANCVFVAPSLIAHYIDSHDYSPPVEFQEAVLNCPPMRSMAYLKAIQAKSAFLTRLARR